MNKRAEAERRGRRAETYAAWWLRLHGWRILGRRVRVYGGEVDLVARRGRTLAFVEVKARATVEAADWAVEERHLRRVAMASEVLTARFGKGCDTVRIDLVLIVPGRLPRHKVNVWCR